MIAPKILKAEYWILAILMAALCGNVSAAAIEIAGVGDDMMRVIVRAAGSLAGAILAVTTIPPGPNDATKSRFLMLSGAFAAGVISGGVIAEYFAPKIGLDAGNYDVALASYGAGAYVVWLLMRFIGRSAARVQDVDAAISLWGRLRGTKDEPKPRRRSSRG